MEFINLSLYEDARHARFSITIDDMTFIGQELKVGLIETGYLVSGKVGYEVYRSF